MSNGMPTDDDADIGTTASKFSKAVTFKDQTMDRGDMVQYDPANNAYPEGTSPALSYAYSDSDKDVPKLTKGFDNPEYTVPGAGPQKASF